RATIKVSKMASVLKQRLSMNAAEQQGRSHPAQWIGQKEQREPPTRKTRLARTGFSQTRGVELADGAVGQASRLCVGDEGKNVQQRKGHADLYPSQLDED